MKNTEKAVKHEHHFSRSKASASVETCGCGKFRFTENAGEAIVEVPAVTFGDAKDLTWELAQVCAHRDALLKAMRDIRDCMAFPDQVEGSLTFRVLSVATAAISESKHFIRV